VARELAAGDSVLRVSRGNAARGVYDNAGRSLQMSMRKIIKNRGSFPNEEAAMKRYTWR